MAHKLPMLPVFLACTKFFVRRKRPSPDVAIVAHVLVQLRNRRRSKLTAKWRGPVRVIAIVSPDTVSVALTHEGLRLENVVNVRDISIAEPPASKVEGENMVEEGTPCAKPSNSRGSLHYNLLLYLRCMQLNNADVPNVDDIIKP